jgi:hypothetical protein
MTVHHLVPNPTNRANRFAKTRRNWLEPISDPKNNPHFEPLPIINNVNLTLPLRVIVPEIAARAEREKSLVFHVTGDSGGTGTQSAAADGSGVVLWRLNRA